MFEPLEPRVLLSADPVSADISASLLGEESAAAIVQAVDAAMSVEITIRWPDGGESIAWDGIGPGGPPGGGPQDDGISSGPTSTGGGETWDGIGPGGPAGGSPLDGDISGGPVSTGGGETWDGIGPGGPGWNGTAPGGPAGDSPQGGGIGPGGPTDLIDPDDPIRTGQTPAQSTPIGSSAPPSDSSRDIMGGGETLESVLNERPLTLLPFVQLAREPFAGTALTVATVAHSFELKTNDARFVAGTSESRSETPESALPERPFTLQAAVQPNPSFDEGLAELLSALESGIWQLAPEPFARTEPTVTFSASSAFEPAALDALFARLVAAQRAQGAATKDVAAPRVLVSWPEVDRGSESLRFLLRFN
jgi:hypothetical protein